MTRATGADGRPWWLSSGPPAAEPPPTTGSAGESRSEGRKLNTGEPQSKSNPADGPDIGADLFNAGIGFMSAVAGLLAKPAPAGAENQPPEEPHTIEACGVCPLCLALAALRERDPEVAEVMEMAMRGVTVSAERVAALVPRATDAITEVLVGHLVKAAMSRFTGR